MRVLQIILICATLQPAATQILENKAPRAGIAATAKPYDVLHYAVDAKLGMIDNSFSGRMTITVLITQPTDTLWFHSVGLLFDSVRVEGLGAGYRFYPSDERVTIYPAIRFFVGETLTVFISYMRDPGFPRPEERQGYYYYQPSWQPGFVLANIGYTMSEPYDARLWMPCYDLPDDKATCDISVTVPQGYVAGSNGRLVAVATQGGLVQFRWQEEYPIATYLMCITASEYSTFSHFYHKISNSADSVEVKYYCWPEDSAGSSFSAVLAFQKTTLMMERFSRMFGEFPFEKYGMAVVYPFFAGAMEHQTLTSMHRSIVSVAGYPYYEYVIAHELAHQWWGDLVTCQSFADIWLNEGFASYAEALWNEAEYGNASYEQKMESFLVFNATWGGAIYDPESQGLPIFGSNVYHKAAWVMHMLRRLVGDSTFFNILENYRTAHAYSTATTSDFQSVVDSTTGQNYDWFFDEWIRGHGWPKYAYTSSWNAGTQTYSVDVSQVQDSLWPTFRMPLELRVFTPAGMIVYSVVDSLRFQTFEFRPVTRPDSLQFDPRNAILKQIVRQPGGDRIPEDFRLYQNYPNPFNPETTIEFDLPRTSRVRVDVLDLLGRRIDTILDELKPVGTVRLHYSGSGLASGVYFVRLQAGEVTRIKKMMILR